jgi:type IX secretion system PorP/SprF family membrane protein
MKTTYFATLCFCIVIGWQAFAQEPLITQYNQNPYFINPAAGGTTTPNELMLGYRNQWNGFDGSPKTLFLGGYYSIEGKEKYTSRTKYVLTTTLGTNLKQIGKDTLANKRSILKGIDRYISKIASNKHVWGGNLTYDSYGIFKHISLGGSYSYHLPIDIKHRLVLGLMPTLYQIGIDRSIGNADQAIVNYNSKTLFNLKIGSWFYGDKYYAGFSVANILSNSLSTPTYYLTGGYKFELENEIDLTPSVLLKSGGSTTIQADMNIKATYKQIAFGSLGWRSNQTLLLMAGIHIKQCRLSYSFDLPQTNPSRIDANSHEIWLNWLWK